jgi:hypothetical protein
VDRTLNESLNTPVTASARNLLSTCPSLEPFIPYSQQNALYALKLLGSLAELTRANIQPTSPPVTQQTLPQVNSHPDLAQSIKQKDSTALSDKSILNALLELRQSGKSSRKSPGIFSPILRPVPT